MTMIMQRNLNFVTSFQHIYYLAMYEMSFLWGLVWIQPPPDV